MTNFFTVLSRSRELIHIVVDKGSSDWSCTCESYSIQKNINCYHILMAKAGKARMVTLGQVNELMKNNRILVKVKKNAQPQRDINETS